MNKLEREHLFGCHVVEWQNEQRIKHLCFVCIKIIQFKSNKYTISQTHKFC